MDHTKYMNIENMCGDLHEAFSLEGLKNDNGKIRFPRPLRPIRVRRGPIFIPRHYIPNWWNRVPVVNEVILKQYNEIDMLIILGCLSVGILILYQILYK